MSKIEPFEKNRDQYENWFIKNDKIFKSEIYTIKQFIKKNKIGLEVGVGTGLFAEKLNIKYGLDPSYKMLELAKQRGIITIQSFGENIPFKNSSFDFILLVTSICFLEYINKTLNEIKRILKNNGEIIIGFVDKDSLLGIEYQKKRKKSKFYKNAIFYSINEILNYLKKTGFKNIKIKQTLIKDINIRDYYKTKNGYGDGSFIVIKGKK